MSGGCEEIVQGTIYKGIGGFYTVKADDGRVLECRARGIFRKRGLKPVAGDRVVIGQEAGTHTIDEILPRRNLLARPPVANVDRLFIVAATADPVPSFLVIDKLTAAAIDQEIEPVLVVTKPDLENPDTLMEAYRTSGLKTLVVRAAGPEGPAAEELEALRALLRGAFSVFCGNSGVGKTTLLNALLPGTDREVGETSRKLGRGRHTTREVEILEVGPEGPNLALRSKTNLPAPGAAPQGCRAARGGEAGEAWVEPEGPSLAERGEPDAPQAGALGSIGLVADTPGFASFDLQGSGQILADNLQLCFPEIKRLVGQCKFSGCTHLAETGCAVRAAVEAGEISTNRYESYVTLYLQAKEAENSY